MLFSIKRTGGLCFFKLLQSGKFYLIFFNLHKERKKIALVPSVNNECINFKYNATLYNKSRNIFFKNIFDPVYSGIYS